MYKPYADSYLITKSKKTLIEYLRIAEHNHRVCEETIDQQAINFAELLKKERINAIDEFAKQIIAIIDDIGYVNRISINQVKEQLKKGAEND